MADLWHRLIANPPNPTDPAERAGTFRRLNLIAALALADAVLLGFLINASLSDNDDLVHVLGPIHGGGFVILVALCYIGARQRRWGWWFPALVVVTFGPPGSLVGDWLIRRRLTGGR